MKNYKDLKSKLLKNKEIKNSYDNLGAEFALVEMIIDKRLSEGLSQAQLAKKIGSKQPVISRLEQGTYNPSVKFLTRVARALNAKLEIFIS